MEAGQHFQRLVLIFTIFGSIYAAKAQETAGAPASPAKSFVCPEAVGDFEDPEQCDKFWHCEAGVATPRLCDDGLVFDHFKADGREDPCESPFVIDCTGRPKMQEPTFPSKFCPRRHGIFPDPDEAVCDRFYTCKNGRHTMTPCSPSLHFNIKKGNCDWPESAGRVGCAAKKKESVDGFTCPPVDNTITVEGTRNPHPSYPNLEDCRIFYTCLNGITPRKSACDKGKVFDERRMLCDYPSEVPECEGWYRDDPEFAHFYYDDTAATGKASDPGAVETII